MAMLNNQRVYPIGMGLLRTNANHQPRFFDPEPSFFFGEGSPKRVVREKFQVMFQSFLGKVKSYSNREELNQLFCLFGVYLVYLKRLVRPSFPSKLQQKNTYEPELYIINWLVVWTPLTNMSSSGGMIIPNRWKTNHVPNHQPAIISPLYPH